MFHEVFMCFMFVSNNILIRPHPDPSLGELRRLCVCVYVVGVCVCVFGGRLTGALTLSVGEVEEQTQGEQQRQQQQRGSGSVHGGTAWHQHALAASVALAHRAL